MGRWFRVALVGATIAAVTPAVWLAGWLMERAQWQPEEDDL